MNCVKTRPVQVAIGERRKPEPCGRPGYLRVETVHQGDREGMKGVYHIKAVDEVTEWQVVGAVSAITQSHLKAVLQEMLEQFPFPVRGFHSDNGSSGYLSANDGRVYFGVHQRYGLRPVEESADRADEVQSSKENDNGLVESKNGAVIRKRMGYGHIGRRCSGSQRFLSPEF